MPAIDELGLTVQVLIYGTPATEYIEAIDDSEFSVWVKTSDPSKECHQFGGDNTRIAFYLYIDNQYMTNRVINPRICLESTLKGHEQALPGSEDCIFRRFRFGAVNTVDADVDKDSFKQQVKEAGHLGKIVVKVYRVFETGVSSRSSDEPPSTSSKAFSEKAFKGKSISHRAAFSHPSTQRLTRPVSICYHDEHPLAMFNFSYRSRQALQAEGIIPRSPTRSPSSIDGLSREDVERLARERLRDIKVEGQLGSRGTKRELDDADHSTGPHRPLKILKGEDGKETVDLTDD